MRRKITNIVSVLISFIRMFFIKIFHFSTFKYHVIERFSPNVVIELEKSGVMSLGKMVRAHSGCKMKVRKGAILNIGNKVSFNYNCMLFSHEKIEIEDGVEFGPNVLIYDHDHDYQVKGGIKAGKFRCAPVKIERNAWIGANTVILKGSIIGENAVVAAGSIVKGSIPANSIFIQKR